MGELGVDLGDELFVHRQKEANDLVEGEDL